MCGRLQSTRYRAPEVQRWNASLEGEEVGGGGGEGGVRLPGTAADIWSAGCVLLELFTGHKIGGVYDKRLVSLK